MLASGPPEEIVRELEIIREEGSQHATRREERARAWLWTYFALLLLTAAAAGVAAFALIHGWKVEAFALAALAALLLLFEAILRPDALARDDRRAAVALRSLENEARALLATPLTPAAEEEGLRRVASWRGRLLAESRESSGLRGRLEQHPGGLLPAILAVALAAGLGAGVAQAVSESDDSGGETPTIGTSPVQPPTGDDEQLAREFAPILHLGRDEYFAPIERARYVQLTRVLAIAGGKPTYPPFTRREADLGKPSCSAPCKLYLDVEGIEPRNGIVCYASLQDRMLVPNVPAVRRALDAEAPAKKRQKAAARRGRCPTPPIRPIVPPEGRPAVYYHVWRPVAGGPAGAIQYWFLYLFNGFENWHESDWEEVTIRLGPEERLRQVFYSAHEHGFSRFWTETPKVGEHVRVFVARGSHANYFRQGKFRVTFCIRRGICKKLRFPRDSADGCGDALIAEGTVVPQPLVGWSCSAAELRNLGPRSYVLLPLRAPHFAGDWGYGNFVLHGKWRVQESGPTDPLLRKEWRNPLKVFPAPRG